MKNFNKIFCFVFFFDICYLAHSELYYIPKFEPEIKMRTTKDTLPWIGVLRVKHKLVDTELISIVILIAKNYAIGCAEDISKIDKKILNSSTMVTFYNYKLIPWNTFVANYYLHPEYHEETINTIAVLKLESKLKVPNFMWKPVGWARTFYDYKKHFPVYNIGYTDRGKILQQYIKRVTAVDKEKCIDFYTKEGLDFKRIWPTHYNCFKVVGEKRTCVYEAGMAVAYNNSGQWTLIGIGTYGPGCSVPARFIEFFPYIPWIESIIGKPTLEGPVYTRRYSWKEELGEDSDTKLLAVLYNYTIDLLPNVPKETYWKGLNPTEECPGSSRIIYQEKGYVKLRAPIPIATVFYSLSLTDEKYEDIQCIRVKLDCLQKSKTQVFVQRGFGQDNLEHMTKHVQLPTKDPSAKIIFVTDEYKRLRNMTVTTVWFKFNFLRTGRIHVTFYGKLKPPTTPTTTSTILPSTTESSNDTTSTTIRTYPTYLAWDTYKQGSSSKTEPVPTNP